MNPSTILFLVVGFQEVIFCLAGGLGCYAVMGENMIRGSQGRREKMEERGGGGGMREEGRKDGEGGWGMWAKGVGCQSGGG